MHSSEGFFERKLLREAYFIFNMTGPSGQFELLVSALSYRDNIRHIIYLISKYSGSAFPSLPSQRVMIQVFDELETKKFANTTSGQGPSYFYSDLFPICFLSSLPLSIGIAHVGKN